MNSHPSAIFHKLNMKENCLENVMCSGRTAFFYGSWKQSRKLCRESHSPREMSKYEELNAIKAKDL